MTAPKTRGELFLLVTIFMEGLYPVLVQQSIGTFPPIFFGGLSALIAAFFLFWHLWRTKTLTKGLTKQVMGYILMVVLCIVIFGHIFVFVGSRYTTGINVGLLLRFELVTTFFVGMFIAKDRLSSSEIAGAVLIGLGTICILFNGTLHLNKGDLIVLAATVLFPFGNFYAKKALQFVSPMQVLFWRYAIGGSFLLILSPFVEPEVFSIPWSKEALLFLLFFGTAMLIASKTCFYTALRYLQLTNVIFIVAAMATALTLVFSYLLLGETPTGYQWIGFAVSVVGSYCMSGKARFRHTADHV